MTEDRYELRPIGRVESPLIDRAGAPRQADEGAPAAWIVLDADVAPAARDVAPGQTVLLLTWLHRATRDVLVTRPRDDPARPATGVFSTRSPDRPNPVGLHEVEVTDVVTGPEGTRIRVRHLEAIDGTPVLDLKPLLRRRAAR